MGLRLALASGLGCRRCRGRRRGGCRRHGDLRRRRRRHGCGRLVGEPVGDALAAVVVGQRGGQGGASHDQPQDGCRPRSPPATALGSADGQRKARRRLRLGQRRGDRHAGDVQRGGDPLGGLRSDLRLAERKEQLLDGRRTFGGPAIAHRTGDAVGDLGVSDGDWSIHDSAGVSHRVPFAFTDAAPLHLPELRRRAAPRTSVPQDFATSRAAARSVASASSSSFSTTTTPRRTRRSSRVTSVGT